MNTITTKGTKFVFSSLFIFFWAINLFAQNSDSQAIKSVLSRDSLFWLAYNTCDTASIGDFYTDDVEFSILFTDPTAIYSKYFNCLL
jgi:hypothetical protein